MPTAIIFQFRLTDSSSQGAATIGRRVKTHNGQLATDEAKAQIYHSYFTLSNFLLFYL